MCVHQEHQHQQASNSPVCMSRFAQSTGILQAAGERGDDKGIALCRAGLGAGAANRRKKRCTRAGVVATPSQGEGTTLADLGGRAIGAGYVDRFRPAIWPSFDLELDCLALPQAAEALCADIRLCCVADDAVGGAAQQKNIRAAPQCRAISRGIVERHAGPSCTPAVSRKVGSHAWGSTAGLPHTRANGWGPCWQRGCASPCCTLRAQI